MTIKMKDMLVLPVKRTAGRVMPFLKDGNNETMFVGSRYHVDLCVTAINAYDTNQERINDLDELRKGSMNCIKQQREEITKQQQEIAELKAVLADITKEENIHPIKDWAICGICTNSSSGSEGRETRMKKFYKFFELIDHANKLLEK